MTMHTRARLLAGAALLAIAAASPSLAQNAAQPAQDGAARVPQEATQVDEIVITGIRAGIEASISAKANNTSIVEVVSAEDIGKLPDVSIAESLARLPGVASQRLDGRSQAISIRGLGPDFTTALLNGRELVTTGDNRGVEFDQFPSELLSSVVVYKTPDAALIGQGLGGTVDLRTVRPLEFGRQAVALNYRVEWNDIGALNSGTTDQGERYSISYIDQFANDTIGVALGYAHMSSPYQSERFNSWGYPTIDIGDDRYGQTLVPDGPRTVRPGYEEEIGNLVIGGVKPYVMSSELERDGYMAVLEWSPNDRFRTNFDAFYSEFENTQVLRGIEFPLQWGDMARNRDGTPILDAGGDPVRGSPTLLPNTTIEDGLIVAGSFANVKGVVRNDLNYRDSTVTALGWNTEFQASENWSLTLDVNYSKVERNDIVLESLAGTGRNALGATDTVDFVINDDGVVQFTSSIDYADPNLILLTSPQGWGADVIEAGQDGYMNTPSVEDEIKAVRFTARRELHQSPFSSIDFGVNLSEREKSFVNDQFYLQVPGSATLPVPSEFLLAPTDLGYLGISQVLSYDPLALVESGFYNLVRNPNADVIAGNWEVTEKVSTAYIRANIEHFFLDRPLSGNVGIQFVHTDQASSGFSARQAGQGVSETIAVSGGADYLEILPSANLILELGDDLFTRFGVSRTLARPRMDDMRASQNYGFNTLNNNDQALPDLNSPWSGGGGNPELMPFIANVADISIERYFADRRGYVSLAAFYKHLESYVFTRSQIFDFTGYPSGGVTPVINQGLVTAPDNGAGGHIQGLEFALSVPLEVVTPALEGFGFFVSASQTESEIQPDETLPPTPLPGLSETVANITAYYERFGFQARVSARYRSDFLGEVAGFGNSRTLRSVGEETVVDAQVGYEFQSGPAEGLSILAQVNNLTDEPFYTFENADERRVIDHHRYGRTFLVGLNYRF